MAFMGDPQHPVKYLPCPPVVTWEDPQYLPNSEVFQWEDGELDYPVHPTQDANLQRRLAHQENLINQIATQQWRTREDPATLLRILRRVEQLSRTGQGRI